VADRPIIFSAPMILALLAGRKTQTRRIIKAQPSEPLKVGDHVRLGMLSMVGDVTWPLKPGISIVSNKPGPHPRWVEEHVKYAVGDRLYVRENIIKTVNGIVYAADAGDAFAGAKPKITPCIHMPRTASRMTLIVTDVRVERLQGISRDDAMAEGIFQIREPDKDGMRHFTAGAFDTATRPTPEKAFEELWRLINGPESWEANPWVVAVSFEVVNRNIDDMPVAA
jgi:hypothetical protein